MNNIEKKMNAKVLCKPALIFIAGIIICIVCAPLTQSVNGGVAAGLLIIMIGTVMLVSAIYNEIYRMGIDTPFPLSFLFPNYPIVEDRDATEAHISGFREAVNDYLSDDSIKKNSDIQKYSSQLLWHSVLLWKMRMMEKGITLSLNSNRRAYTSKKNCVRNEEFFDGRYNVNDVYEEIDAERIFKYKGREIKKIHDKEVAHFTLLSLKETEDNKFICPNCGGITTRSDLIDGCDYCDTKFSVEDMENSVSSFGFRRDFSVSESKREKVRELIYPWVFVITEMPFVYFGFFGAFLYMTESFAARLFTGLLAAVLLGLFGLFVVKLNMAFLIPFIIARDTSKKRANRKLIYRPEEDKNKELEMAEYVRQFDSKFSIQSFFGGINNKLMAIHFADRKEQINAFSDMDLSSYLDGYKNVIDVDVTSISLESYNLKEGNMENKDGSQYAVVQSDLLLRELIGDAIKERNEKVEMHLEKNGRLRTQAVCAPSLMKCKSCGASLSLLDGKKCLHCGNELDMKKYDWVITDYRIFDEKGK